jgi:hypothetical protein
MLQIVLNHVAALLRRAVGNNFFARFEHFVRIFPVGRINESFGKPRRLLCFGPRSSLSILASATTRIEQHCNDTAEHECQ